MGVGKGGAVAQKFGHDMQPLSQIDDLRCTARRMCAFGQPHRQGLSRGVRQFLSMIAADPRLEATAIQTVGEKGWDGFVIAVVG